jgi:hypothetical protein
MSEVPHWKLKATCSRREVGMVLQQDRALHMVLVIFQELGVDVLELSVFQHCLSVRKRLELMNMSLAELGWGGDFLWRASRNWGRRGLLDCRGLGSAETVPLAMLTKELTV